MIDFPKLKNFFLNSRDIFSKLKEFFAKHKVSGKKHTNVCGKTTKKTLDYYLDVLWNERRVDLSFYEWCFCFYKVNRLFIQKKGSLVL